MVRNSISTIVPRFGLVFLCPSHLVSKGLDPPQVGFYSRIELFSMVFLSCFIFLESARASEHACGGPKSYNAMNLARLEKHELKTRPVNQQRPGTTAPWPPLGSHLLMTCVVLLTHGRRISPTAGQCAGGSRLVKALRGAQLAPIERINDHMRSSLR